MFVFNLKYYICRIEINQIMNYTEKLKKLEVGKSIILEGRNYDSVITTNSRLKRNGFGTFSVESIEGKLLVTRTK